MAIQKKLKTKKDFRLKILKLIDDNKNDLNDKDRDAIMRIRSQVEIQLRD
jgi:hypothetical protein